MLTLSQVFWRFRLAIYLYWSMSAAFVGYWVVYFEENRGVSPADIGLMMSLYTFSALTGQYAFGYLSDKLRSIRLPILVAAVALAAVVLTFPWQTSLNWVYPSMALVGFLQQPIGPMLDSWTLKHLSRHHAQQMFGRIRGFGSLGWATTALLTSYLILLVSWNMMFFTACVAALLLVVTILAIPDYSQTPQSAGDCPPRLTLQRAARQLFGNSAYLYMLVVIFFMSWVQTTFNFKAC